MAGLMTNIGTWCKAALLVAIVFIIACGPFGINVSNATPIAFVAVFSLNIVPSDDLFDIAAIVCGPSIAVLSIMVLSILPQNIGVFGGHPFDLAQQRRQHSHDDPHHDPNARSSPIETAPTYFLVLCRVRWSLQLPAHRTASVIRRIRSR
jgi:hypothetical protein